MMTQLNQKQAFLCPLIQTANEQTRGTLLSTFGLTSLE
jgi:hypothetical protein